MKHLILLIAIAVAPLAMAEQEAPGGAQDFANSCGLEQAKSRLGSDLCDVQKKIISKISFDQAACIASAATNTDDLNLFPALIKENSYDLATLLTHVQSELQTHISSQCPNHDVTVDLNEDRQSLRVEINKREIAQAPIRDEVLAAVKDLDDRLQHYAMSAITDACDGSGGPGESDTLGRTPAHDVSEQLNISLNQAIELNSFLLNEAAAPCSDTLIAPAVERRPPLDPYKLPDLKTI